MNAVVRVPALTLIRQETPPSPSPLQNQLLASLSEEVQLRLFPRLQLCSLRQGAVLAQPGTEPEYFYFPVDCLISHHCMMGDSPGTVTAVVGNDGLTGIDLFMENSAPSISIVQMAGNAFRIDSAWIRQELDRFGEVLSVLFRYTHGLLAQMAQTAVCNRHHTLEQQFCRWLLLAFDRIPGDTLDVTQDQIAQSLGVRRQTVTDVAGKLQRRGIIKGARGHLTLLDRAELASSSCDCSQVVRRESTRAWPTGAPRLDETLGYASRHYH